MGKTIPLTGKFAENECDQVDAYARSNGLSRSAAIHQLVMAGLHSSDGDGSVTFRFLEDYSYFWKGREYAGFIRGDEAHVLFGGDWKIYKLADIPVEIVGG